ncbi:MAG: hypothetical protein RIC95_00040 [Vicingaceae bacterium]
MTDKHHPNFAKVQDYLNQFSISLEKDAIGFRPKYSFQELRIPISKIETVQFSRAQVPFWHKVFFWLLRLSSYRSSFFMRDLYRNEHGRYDYRYFYDFTLILHNGISHAKYLKEFDVFKMKEVIDYLNQYLAEHNKSNYRF